MRTFSTGKRKENISFNMNWFFFLMVPKCRVLAGPSLAPGEIPTRGAGSFNQHLDPCFTNSVCHFQFSDCPRC